MLIAAREGDQARFEAPGFPEVTLQGLSDGEARDLVASRVAGIVGGAEVESLIRTAGGNPLALLELPLQTRMSAGGERARQFRQLPPARSRRCFELASNGSPIRHAACCSSPPPTN